MLTPRDRKSGHSTPRMLPTHQFQNRKKASLRQLLNASIRVWSSCFFSRLLIHTIPFRLLAKVGTQCTACCVTGGMDKPVTASPTCSRPALGQSQSHAAQRGQSFTRSEPVASLQEFNEAAGVQKQSIFIWKETHSSRNIF